MSDNRRMAGRIRVVLAPHVSERDRLGCESALSAGGIVQRTDRMGEYIVEVLRRSRLNQLCHALPHWQRSGVAIEWEVLDAM